MVPNSCWGFAAIRLHVSFIDAKKCPEPESFAKVLDKSSISKLTNFTSLGHCCCHGVRSPRCSIFEIIPLKKQQDLVVSDLTNKNHLDCHNSEVAKDDFNIYIYMYVCI